jgi:hypothetical protein
MDTHDRLLDRGILESSCGIACEVAGELAETLLASRDPGERTIEGVIPEVPPGVE